MFTADDELKRHQESMLMARSSQNSSITRTSSKRGTSPSTELRPAKMTLGIWDLIRPSKMTFARRLVISTSSKTTRSFGCEGNESEIRIMIEFFKSILCSFSDL